MTTLLLPRQMAKIVAIEEIEENEYFNDRRLQVSIFMSPLNVHVNLFPIAGTGKILQIPSR
jgi:phosphatidylserine decarboxylase